MPKVDWVADVYSFCGLSVHRTTDGYRLWLDRQDMEFEVHEFREMVLEFVKYLLEEAKG